MVKLDKREYCDGCHQVVKKEDSFKKHKRTFDLKNEKKETVLPIYDVDLYKRIIEDQRQLVEGQIDRKKLEGYLKNIIQNIIKCYNVNKDDICYIEDAQKTEIYYKGFLIKGQKEGYGLEYQLVHGKIPNMNQPHEMCINLTGEPYKTIWLTDRGVWRVNHRHDKNFRIYSSGKIFYQGGMNLNDREGYGKAYHTNGQLKYECNFRNNEVHDQKVKEYLSNGSLYRIANFDNGKPYGFIKEYTFYGKLRSCGFSKPNKKDSKYDEYYKTRETYGIFDYIPQHTCWEGFAQKYEDNGLFNYIGQMRGIDQNGYGIMFNQEIKIKYEGIFVRGLLEGRKEKVYYRGNLVYKGNMKRGQHNGYGKEFNKNGRLIYAGKFVNGYRIGEGISFCENGKSHQLNWTGRREFSVPLRDYSKFLEDFMHCQCDECKEIYESMDQYLYNYPKTLKDNQDGMMSFITNLQGQGPLVIAKIRVRGYNTSAVSYSDSDDYGDDDIVELVDIPMFWF